MTDELPNPGGPPGSASSAPGLPTAVDRAIFQAELDRLRIRERRTPGKATRSPRPAGACPWSRWMPASR
jgi:hypothetical protein